MTCSKVAANQSAVARDPERPWRTSADPCSPIMMAAAFVLAEVIVGMTEASTTRRPRTPRTRSCGRWPESACHQVMRWSTSSSGAGCAARSQRGSICTPSPTCASQSFHSGGPRAGAMRGGWESTPMWSRILLTCAPCVMNAMRRIGPPHRGAQQRENLVDTGDENRPQIVWLATITLAGVRR